ncbi:class I SAM-dependent methyltransferase [Paenibacillus sp. MBLB4367]|uniref:class I SAM-dependent methyltransferase n=1 Tax=Paenibacillus sp. MBLB4367 TaxID=3384767 RepID=UPI0039081A6A
MAHFDKLTWLPDRLLAGELVFRNEYNKNADWELGEACIPLIKTKGLMNAYREFFARRPDFTPSRIFEIGMFSGGSIALWYEIFEPAKIVGIDLQANRENGYFQRYVADNGLGDRIKTYWSVNQADSSALSQIVQRELPDGIDIVFDDASHLYGPTKRSFETLFPLLRAGGFYIVEDWNWAHTPAFQQEDSIWRSEVALTQLIFDLVEAAGSSGHIASLFVSNGFAAVEKSALPLDAKADFRLEDVILRRNG